MITPIYRSKSLRVADVLSDDIQQGRFTAGMLLPTECELARMYRVSGMTMRKSLAILAEKGVVVRVPQKGTLIPAPEPLNGSSVDKSKDFGATSGPMLTISAVWAAEPDAHMVGISEGVKKYAREAGLHLQLILSPEGHGQALDFLEKVIRYPVEGVLVLPYGNSEYVSMLRRLVECSFPVVCIDRQIEGVETSSVEVDNAAGEYRATHYLIEKYHRPVYFFGCALEHKTTQDRYHGFERAMVDAGFEDVIGSHTVLFDVSDSDPAYWPQDKKPQSAAAGAERFLNGVRLPAGVVCINDYAARALHEAATKRGLFVGRDLMIIGFDDVSMAKFLKPALSTIHQPSMQVGYDAAKLLHHIILGNVKPPVHVHLPVELVVRESA